MGFIKPGYVLAYWRYGGQGYDLGGQFQVPNAPDNADIILTPYWLPLARYNYPAYTTSLYGARIIYDPDYIKGGN